MTLNFLPSLEHFAAVRVALTIYNDDNIHLFEELVLTDEAKILDPFFHLFISTRQERWTNERKMKARDKLSKLLPKILENRILHIFQPLVEEINFWFRDHFHVIKHIGKSHYINSLCWKSEGTIDRIKTAKQLVRNESIDKRVRFVMACIYFWENDVLHLWQSMTADERQSIFRIDSNIATKFWMEWLRGHAKSPWTQCVKECLRFEFLDPILNYDTRYKCSRVRLSSFFIELNTFSKSFFLHCLWPEHAHIDDLRLCYNLLDEAERAEIFHSDSKARDVLCCYLHWPYQSLFLDVLNQVKSHLRPYCFQDSLRQIVYKKLMRGVQDFDYLQLLKDLWNQIPDSYKVEMQKQRDFTLVRAAMSYDAKTHPLPIEELLNECRTFMFALPLYYSDL
ncbi:hypothetical protein AVEN_229520-1 [Araneus ventricosus]|uniref:Uncharacterized protein n=1 Tax=Araneus ventricosus TaxID=182803 RepID=A0A4Y2EJ95_ARAVE|nr:hypothetical protein AVEN_229520-1 [Araneus ventricosus]